MSKRRSGRRGRGEGPDAHGQDLHSAETQILDARPDMIEAARSEDLRDALQEHLEETREQKKRLEETGSSLDVDVDGPKCKGMVGIISEGEELLEDNPTVRVLEETLAELEGGAGGVATSSGLAAVSTVCMALLEAGAHVVGTASVYGPSRGLVEKHWSRFGVDSSFVDTTDLDALRAALRPETRLVYVESPANPTMQVTDLAGAARIAHAHGALLVVDDTFASPYLQKPLELGADVVLHSVTKFINGHADVVGGIVTARDPDVLRSLRDVMIASGCNMDPHQAFLVLRGLKTPGIRVERAQANALRIARWLEAHPGVARVRYVGIPSHPQHELAKRQMRGFGSMIAFEPEGGMEAGRALMDHVRLATLAVSLGGVETLVEHPASTTHAAMSREDREAAGFTDGLVRYSVGIEDADDLIADLEQALEAVEQAGGPTGSPSLTSLPT